MSQAKANKLYRTFLKGLVTEASPLTFPPDTSYDEDNCLIFVAGNRARRLGMDYEDDHELSSHSLSSPEDAPLIEYVWRNVQNNEGVDFLVHQVQDFIYFYDCSGSPTSANLKTFSIDLSDYFVAGHPSPSSAPVQMVSGKGYLFIASDSIDPLLVEYSQDDDDITVSTIEILTRDFDGVDDGLAVEQEINTISAEHRYNLQNQGWTGDAVTTTDNRLAATLYGKYITIPKTTVTSVDVIKKYFDVIGKYPANNKQWFLGKVEVAGDGYGVGDFNPTLLNKSHVGNSRAPRGHFILNAFTKDRSAVSGIPGIATDIKSTRPVSICFAAGRVWYAHENNVFFSQVFSSKAKAGICFQDNDPTAEDLSDLLDNDGGVIPVPAADKIVLVKEVSNGVMVFANNGVWFISGGDKGFSATDYQVTKVYNIGTDAPSSVVDTQNHIYFWSKVGICRIEQSSGMFGPISGNYQSTNLTENTIDSFIKDIDTTVRKYVKGVFDHGTNTIYWMFADSDVGVRNFYNRFINFNVITESFYPWSLVSGNYPYVTGIYVTSDINRVTNSEPVTSNGSVVTAGGVTVTASGTTLSAKDTFVQYILAEPQDDDSYKFTIGSFNNDNFVDWETYDDTGVAFNSYVETGFEILDDAARNKWIVYLQPFFRQTEENFVAVGDDYIYDKPSSCYLTTKWDWSDSTRSNKWSTRVQTYRLRNVPLVNPLDLSLDTGFKVVTTRNRVRGQGRALQFRYECNEVGKNFDILGWQVFYQGNTEV